MCQYLSFIATPKGEVFCGRLSSHNGVESGWGLVAKTDHFHECEWTDNHPDSLEVRGYGGGMAGKRLDLTKKRIIERFATRKALIKAVKVGRTGEDVFFYRNGESHNHKRGPAKVVIPASAGRDVEEYCTWVTKDGEWGAYNALPPRGARIPDLYEVPEPKDMTVLGKTARKIGDSTCLAAGIFHAEN